MSLYVGNLSSRIRRDELKRVFRRFGQCDVRMKDGYGFVVYDFPPNAEKALRALQKSYICGEPLTLTWSNKQPRTFKRFARATGSHENQRDRHSMKGEDNVKEMLASNDQDDGINVKQSEVVFHEDDAKDNLGQENPGYREEFSDEPDPVGSDRWGDQPNETGVGHTIEFERYEPSQGYSRKLDDGIPGGSSARQTSQKVIDRARIDGNLRGSSGTKLQVTCYRCGGSGHKMRYCPLETSSLRKYNRVASRGETKMGRFGSRSREMLQVRKDAVVRRQLKNDVKSSGLGKHQRPTSSGSSPVRKETDNSSKKNYEGNKQPRNEVGSSERRCTKKTGMSFLSPHHSDYTASQSSSTSQSTEHVKRCRAHSSSSESRSLSTSHYYRSKKSKSKSSPTSLSVSFSNEDETLENTMVAVNGENGKPPSKAVDEMRDDQPLEEDNEGYPKATRSLGEVTNLRTSGAEQKGTIDSHKGLEELASRNSDELMTEHVSDLVGNSDSEPLVSSHTGNSMNISSEELSMVMKHYYGLNIEIGNERHLPADVYFGSARFWPWEVIYYRRLKKGPTSVENYARRVDQNREFGIVDKYIRSSSGWGELNHANP